MNVGVFYDNCLKKYFIIVFKIEMSGKGVVYVEIMEDV